MKVTLVYNLKKDAKTECTSIDYYSEFDSVETIESIAEAIRVSGHEVSLTEADTQIIDRLLEQTPDIVFNIAEGSNGTSRESQVPAILDYLGIPYTGSGVLTLALSLDKCMSKKVFIQNSIPTPKYQLFKNINTALEKNLTFPLIVKPNREGSAKGITKTSVVYNESRLYEEIGRIMEEYKQEALVEEFIDGKELTVGVLGNSEFLDLPILEIDFSTCRNSGEYFYSWRMKEYQGSQELGLTPTFYCPARLDRNLTAKVKETAYKAHLSLGCNDISRVDIRLSRDNIPYVLEVNPLPGLDPKESNFPVMTNSAGMKYEELIGTILKLTIARYGIGEYIGGESLFGNTSTEVTFSSPMQIDISKQKEGDGKNVI
jgi:D-alanine-D-alanine ligase